MPSKPDPHNRVLFSFDYDRSKRGLSIRVNIAGVAAVPLLLLLLRWLL